LVAIHPEGNTLVINAVPVATPITTPVEEPTVAMVVLLEDHVPPVTISLKVTEDKLHTTAGPVIGSSESTVTSTVAIQPVLVTTKVVIAVPALMPVITPVEEPIVATVVVPLTHVPPPVASVTVIVLPTQTVVLPAMVSGSAFTVSVLVMIQPVGKVYVIMAVPGVPPVAIEPPMETTPILLLLHVPPPVASVSVTDKPVQMPRGPPIAAGNGLTVIVSRAIQLPGKV
jgi:hypothetical protein